MCYAPRMLVGLLLVLLVACVGTRPPEWAMGPSGGYPSEVYLTGVGVAAERARAEDRARAEIAKILQVQIQSRDASTESQWLSRIGDMASGEYRQSVQAELITTTNKVLEGVRIAETWQDRKTDEYYALAVLDRLRAGRALREELDDIDQTVTGHVRLAETEPSVLRRLGRYLQALAALERRGGIAADLRIVDPSGWVAEPPYRLAEINERADREAAAIRIGVELTDDRQGIVEGALTRALVGLGMQLAPAAERDLLVRGSVDVESFAASEPWMWAIASAQVEFVTADGTVLDALRTSVKEGSQIAPRADTLAREHLGERLAVLVLERLGSLGAAKK